MSTPITPYSGVLAGRDPFAAIHESIEAIRRFTAGSTGERFERSYAPGKWTARQLLIHLAETEIALGNRARMALVTPNYVAQLWDQDTWMPLDARLTGPLASEVFVAVAAMNLSFFEALSPAQLGVSFDHAEYGRLTVEWILYQMAGHQVHHVRQLLTTPDA